MKAKRILSLIMAGSFVLGSQTVCCNNLSASAVSDKARVSVHDPSVFKADDGTYYVWGSHIEAAKSNDLQNWTRFTNGYTTPNNVEFGDLSQNLKKAFDWAGEDLEDCKGGFSVWAPDVIWNPDYINSDGSKGAYVMYFCTSSTYICSVICYATSKTLEGPYTFGDTLIYSGFTDTTVYATSDTKKVNRRYSTTNIDELINSGEVTYNNSWFNNHSYNNSLFPNAIDPTIYYGTDGKMYMVYGSWSGGIFSIEIDKQTGKCIHPQTGTTSDGRMVDSYFGTKIAGGYTKSGEGPFMEYNADTGYYYLWTTYGGLVSEGGYNMRVFRSISPTGPFYDPAGNKAVLDANTNLDSVGLKVMGNYKFSSLDKAYMACGHNSVLRDDDGQWYLLYHARFDDGSEYHEVRVHKMYFNSEGWPVVTPYENSGDIMAEYGYETSDITGDYEYINHGNSTDGKIINYQSIKLNADGTITGAVNGTWSQDKGSSQAVIKIGNQVYNGYFIASKDENGKKVMSFTAVGNNNQTVWGAKTTEYKGKERSALIDYSTDNVLTFNAESVQGTGKTVKIGDTDLLSGVSYFISNKNSGLAIDLPNGKLDDGTNIHQWDKNGLWAQQFRIVSEDNGYCRIVSVGDESKCIAVAENTPDDGTNVELQTYTGADNQLFKIVKNGAYYGILSKCSGEKSALDMYEWSTENGGNVNQFAYNAFDCQLWSITPVYPTVNTGSYTIRNLNSGLYLNNSSGNLVQGANAQKWNVYQNTDGTYSISDINGFEIATEKNSPDNGVNAGCLALDSDWNKLKLQCNKDGSYTVLTSASDYKSSLDVYEISLAEGANICQWEYWGGTGQKFILEPAVQDSEPQKVTGDVNSDGVFNVADIVLLQKYVLGAEKSLPDWQSGDLDSNGRLNVYDVTLMRKLIVK